MIALRGITVFIFSALLTGCLANRCPAPGDPSPTGHTPCYYKLEVVDIDQAKGLVTTKYPKQLMGENGEFEGASTAEFKPFRVRDLDKLQLQKNHVYMFTNGSGSPYLEAFEEGRDFPKELTEQQPFYIRWPRYLIP